MVHFVWVRRALNRQKRRFPARAVDQEQRIKELEQLYEGNIAGEWVSTVRRGAWARVTIGRCRRLALQTFGDIGHLLIVYSQHSFRDLYEYA
jgi:hypothetical protein